MSSHDVLPVAVGYLSDARITNIERKNNSEINGILTGIYWCIVYFSGNILNCSEN
jgi:hypothetical protein